MIDNIEESCLNLIAKHSTKTIQELKQDIIKEYILLKKAVPKNILDHLNIKQQTAILSYLLHLNAADPQKEIIYTLLKTCKFDKIINILQVNKDDSPIRMAEIALWNSGSIFKKLPMCSRGVAHSIGITGVLTLLTSVLSVIKGDKYLDYLIGIPLGIFISIILVEFLWRSKINGEGLQDD